MVNYQDDRTRYMRDYMRFYGNLPENKKAESNRKKKLYSFRKEWRRLCEIELF